MDVVVLPTVSAAESGTPSAAPASTNLLDVHAGSDTVSPAKESLPSKLSKSPRIENFTQYQSQSHWNYLTLLQKQLDVLREQMSYMHIQSPTILENEARAGACYPLPVPQKHSQSIGTNTSVIFPESQSRKLLQSATRRDIEIQANMDTTRIFSDPSLTLDRTGIPCFESSRRLPLDTGTNYKPFFPLSHGEGLSRLSQLRNEISLVSGNIPYSPSPGSMYQTMMEDVTPIVVAPDAIPEEEDSPETSLSKNLIVQMVSNPEKSFIVLEPDDGMETQDTHRFTPSSQFLPDSLGITKPHEFNASSIETSNFDGLSFASWEYLKRHGLVDERDGDTTHGTFQ